MQCPGVGACQQLSLCSSAVGPRNATPRPPEHPGVDGVVPPAIVEQRGGSGYKCPPVPPSLERVPAGLSADTDSAMTPFTYGPGALPTAARALVLGEGVSAPHRPSGPLHESPGRCLQGPSLHAGPEGQGAWHGARAPRVSWGKATDSCKASRRSAAKPRVRVLTRPRLCAAYLPRGVLVPLTVEELPSGRFQRELFPVKLQVWGVCGGAELRVFLGRHRGRAPPGKASSLHMSILLMLPKLRI